MATILEMEILMHYYCTNKDFRNLDAPAIAEAIHNFHYSGLLIGLEGDVKYKANREALKPYIEALQSVPFPIQIWVIEKH